MCWYVYKYKCVCIVGVLGALGVLGSLGGNRYINIYRCNFGWMNLKDVCDIDYGGVKKIEPKTEILRN